MIAGGLRGIFVMLTTPGAPVRKKKKKDVRGFVRADPESVTGDL